MSRGPRISRIKFLAIAKDIANHPHLTNRAIGESHHVSNTTVSSIDRARNWGNFAAKKNARVSIREGVEKTAKLELAKSSGMKPVTRTERATEKLASDLDKLAGLPTRTEFELLERRISLHARQLSYLTRIPIFGRFVRAQLEEAEQDDAAHRQREAQMQRLGAAYKK